MMMCCENGFCRFVEGGRVDFRRPGTGRKKAAGQGQAAAETGGEMAGRGGGRGDGRRDGGCPNRGELVPLIPLDSDILDSGVVMETTVVALRSVLWTTVVVDDDGCVSSFFPPPLALRRRKAAAKGKWRRKAGSRLPRNRSGDVQIEETCCDSSRRAFLSRGIMSTVVHVAKTLPSASSADGNGFHVHQHSKLKGEC